MKQTIIKTMDRATVRQINQEAEEAMREIAEKYGLVLEPKTARYTNSDVVLKFKCLVKETTEDGEVLDTDAKNLKLYAFRHGLGEDAYGKEFVRAGDTYRITGYKPKSRKYPILAENVKTGKTYKFPEHTVQLFLKAS